MSDQRHAEQVQKVGRYELLEKVGHGAMGVVYRAQDPTIRRIVALKVLAADDAGPSPADSSGIRSKADFFGREAQAAGSLLHPNIVTLYDAGRDGPWYYLAMEFIEGGTFDAEIAATGKVSPARAIEVVAAVADALDFAHERGVVHRDIKPANLMILPDHSVKVADFGIARLASATATVAGDAMVGTPHYMSPEQVRGAKVDGRSDLFSLGVVLYEALTGRKPYQADTLPAILHAILNTTPRPLHEVDPTIPKELSAIVAKTISRKVEDRYNRGKELASELRRFASPDTAVERPPEKSSRASAVAIGVVVALLGLGAVMLLRPARTGSMPAVQVEVGYLECVSSPAGAEIFLDGTVVGRTPYTAEVSAGPHEVEFRKEGYYPATQSPRVEPDKHVVVELPLLAR